MIWDLSAYPLLHCFGAIDYQHPVQYAHTKHQHDLVPSSACHRLDETAANRTKRQVSVRTLITVETIVARGLKEGRGIPFAPDYTVFGHGLGTPRTPL